MAIELSSILDVREKLSHGSGFALLWMSFSGLELRTWTWFGEEHRTQGGRQEALVDVYSRGGPMYKVIV